ncbi:MAG: DUF370 domain-containing protein [Leptospira sp.]|jgi:extracellular matrix regulatory protein A|nr:DUF370 domain-containing protein [Leptospira sp.]NCS94474.1 DUF370 domain-containing protein [Leptospira sp.]
MEDYFALNIGFSNIILLPKIVGIMSSDSAGARRLKSEAKGTNMLADATMGRKTRSIILTTSGHIFLSAIRPESLVKRLEKKDNLIAKEEEIEDFKSTELD